MSNFVNLLDIVYPIGSIYISFSNVSPVDSIGGSWEKINGKFLQSSSESEKVNSVGGFSGIIGFQLKYASWYGGLVPTWNQDIDSSLISMSGESIHNNFTSGIVKTDTQKHDSSDQHIGNANLASSTGWFNHPVITEKELYWDTRPAYITCNMYKRIA